MTVIKALLRHTASNKSSLNYKHHRRGIPQDLYLHDSSSLSVGFGEHLLVNRENVSIVAHLIAHPLQTWPGTAFKGYHPFAFLVWNMWFRLNISDHALFMSRGSVTFQKSNRKNRCIAHIKRVKKIARYRRYAFGTIYDHRFHWHKVLIIKI